MKYNLPTNKNKQNKLCKSVMFRLPVDLLKPFNEALKKSGLSAQLLVEDMVRECLKAINND